MFTLEYLRTVTDERDLAQGSRLASLGHYGKRVITCATIAIITITLPPPISLLFADQGVEIYHCVCGTHPRILRGLVVRPGTNHY